MKKIRTSYRVPRTAKKTEGRLVRVESGMKKILREIPNVEAWGKFATEISKTLEPGTILAVQGDLGAGKTTFIQALAKAIGIKRFVPSPTFALMRTYKLPKAVNGIKRLIHVDAYRLKDETELRVLDLDEELADGQSLLVIEWPERIEGWLSEHASKIISIFIA